MVLSAAIGALGSIAGGALSSGLSIYGAKQLAGYQAALNYKYSKKSTLNQYGWQRQGLEKAGYNPLLALNGAEGVPSTGWSSASAPNVNMDPVNSALSALANKRENKLAEANINNIKTDTAIKENQRDLTSLELYNKDLESNYYEQMAKINFDNAVIGNKIKNEILEQSVITSKNLDRKQKAEILNMLSGAENNSAQAWYNRNRALGFTDSYSESDSHSGSYDLGLSLTGGHSAKSGNRSRTRSYSKTR